jgi:hypothetical protein
MNLQKLKRNVKALVLVAVMVTGFVFFLVQCIQFFTGKWLKNDYFELIITVFFLGVAIAPYFILKSFVNKLTNNNYNNMSDKKEEVKEVEVKENEVQRVEIGGSGTDENGEV